MFLVLYFRVYPRDFRRRMKTEAPHGFQGTREHRIFGNKENKAVSTGKKAEFLIFQGTRNIKIDKILLGNKGAQGNFFGEQGDRDPALRPSKVNVQQHNPQNQHHSLLGRKVTESVITLKHDCHILSCCHT